VGIKGEVRKTTVGVDCLSMAAQASLSYTATREGQVAPISTELALNETPLKIKTK